MINLFKLDMKKIHKKSQYSPSVWASEPAGPLPAGNFWHCQHAGWQVFRTPPARSTSASSLLEATTSPLSGSLVLLFWS